MTMTLVERLCAAEGPSRELDAEIARTYVFDFPKGTSRIVPHYTASIDAAMTLVPEGEPYWHGRWANDLGKVGEYASVSRKPSSTAPTPALALCIASLRARESA